ncbi:C10 family peptidase [bacterium]|nr:C10 family peptidase [bacterium]
MRRYIFKMLVTFIVLCSMVLPLSAEKVSREEALNAASNWVTLIQHQEGKWGRAEQAYIEEIQDFTFNEKVVGFFCPVAPKGFILVSPYKEMVPVKAYSDRNDLDPELSEGMTDLLKKAMARAMDNYFKLIESYSRDERGKGMRVHPDWEELSLSSGRFEEELEENRIMTDYSSGDYLLNSNWHQGDPFYNDVPTPGIMGSDCANAHCAVGCVATAGAQIMHYWNWPPYGDGGSPYTDSYAWLNMPDTLDGSSTPEQEAAVAELSQEVGEAVSMDYCHDSCSSSASTANMVGVFKDHYYYSTDCERVNRTDYSLSGWFSALQNQFDKNCPVEYRIVGHAIVGDGYRWSGSIRQYHMNYGWSTTSTDAWFSVDTLDQVDSTGTWEDEYMVQKICPTPPIQGAFSGSYTRNASFPYRYVPRDATCSSTAEIGLGQTIQFLPHTEMKCDGDYIHFHNEEISGFVLRLFSINDRDVKAGMNIIDGGMKIYANGGVRFHGQ